MIGSVYVTPARNLWLHLRDDLKLAVCLHLETGEVRTMHRPIEELLGLGWREWEEAL